MGVSIHQAGGHQGGLCYALFFILTMLWALQVM